MSKLRTNLTPEELDKVAKGLRSLAQSRRLSSLSIALPLECSILTKLDSIMDTYSKSLHREFTRILTEED